MNYIGKITLGEKRLLGVFGILILLTAGIGLIGIIEIQGLSRRIEGLGRRNLKLENAVLEMKINNTVYAMGIRNYIFWKASRYLGAVPMAANLDNIFAAAKRFREQLTIYQSNSYAPRQKKWAEQLEASFNQLSGMGKQIIDLVDKMQPSGLEGAINSLLMAFENRLYAIDDFLDNTLAKDNLNEIEKELNAADIERRGAILFLAVTLISAVLMSSLLAFSVYYQRQRERLYRQQLLGRMINLEENERKNLSAQVHDQMGQDLSALKIYLGVIEQNLASPALEIKEKIAESKKIVSGLIEKSHNIAFMLRPPVIDEMGLSVSLEALVLDYRQLTGVNCLYQKPENEITLSLEHSLLIYRLAQELLTNMAKHAKATQAQIGLSKIKDRVEFSYQDNGVGFDYQNLLLRPKRRAADKFKLGLLGLKERIELFDGVMTIDAKPNRGTRVVVKLPI